MLLLRGCGGEVVEFDGRMIVWLRGGAALGVFSWA